MLNVGNESQYKYNKFKIAVIIVVIISLAIICAINSTNQSTINNPISQEEAEKLVKEFINNKYQINKNEITLNLLENELHYKDKVCKEVNISELTEEELAETSEVQNVGTMQDSSTVIKCDYDENDLYYKFKFVNAKYLDYDYYVNHFSKEVFEIDNTIKTVEATMVGEFSKNGKNKLHTYGLSNKSVDFILNIHEAPEFKSISGTAVKDIDGYKYISNDINLSMVLDKNNNLIITATKVENSNLLKAEHISGTYSPIINKIITNDLIEEKYETPIEEVVMVETNIPSEECTTCQTHTSDINTQETTNIISQDTLIEDHTGHNHD